MTETSLEGHNLGSDEREDLLLFHLNKLRKANAELEDLMEPVRTQKKHISQLRKNATDDGYPVKQIDSILKREGQATHELQEEADINFWMDQIAGLPVGGQADLFANTPAEIRDELTYEGEGYAAGLRGDDIQVRLLEVSPRFHQNLMKGYNAGQERLIRALGRAETRALQISEDDEEPDFDDHEFGEEEE